MFEYGDKVKTIVDGAVGEVMGFMRSRINPEYDKLLVKFYNGNPEAWIRADSLEKVEDDKTRDN